MRILVGMDGSEPALRALEQALKLLARVPEPDNAIDVACVHDPMAVRLAGRLVGSDGIERYLNELADDDLREAQSRLQTSATAHSILRLRGPIAPTLGQAATAGHYDLLTLGAKGRSGIKDLLIGSVAQRVGAHTDVPVLLVR